MKATDKDIRAAYDEWWPRRLPTYPECFFAGYRAAEGKAEAEVEKLQRLLATSVYRDGREWFASGQPGWGSFPDAVSAERAAKAAAKAAEGEK